MPSSTRKVPKSALLFSAGKVEFAAGDDAKPNEVPIRLFARSPEPVAHPYWGRIVHDMAGMTLRKDTCPIDYAHWGRWDDDENIGVGEKFDAGKDGLTIEGRLISIEEGDRAAKLIAKSRAGIPYEASIDFNGPMRLEELSEGVSAEVNGFKFTGPGIIVREWQLRSVAVCPFGADAGTRSEFTSKDRPDEEVEVTIFTTEESSMEKKNPTGKPASDPTQLADPKGQSVPAGQIPPAGGAPTPGPAALSNGQDDPRAELRRFVDKFGAENGAKWFGEGTAFEAALELHITALSEQLAGRDQKIAELQAKLDAIPRGEREPASFDDATPGGNDKRTTEFTNSLGDNLGRFAAGIKMPSRK